MKNKMKEKRKQKKKGGSAAYCAYLVIGTAAGKAVRRLDAVQVTTVACVGCVVAWVPLFDFPSRRKQAILSLLLCHTTHTFFSCMGPIMSGVELTTVIYDAAALR